MKLIKNIIIFCSISILLNACAGGSNSSSSSDTSVSIGTANNGSQVFISQESFSVAQGGSTSGKISIQGGKPNTTVKITFNLSESQSKGIVNNQNSGKISLELESSDNGITITTLPSTCLLGTTGTNLPTSCSITIAASSVTTPEAYKINPVTADDSGVEVDLSSVPLVVTQPNLEVSTQPNPNIIGLFSNLQPVTMISFSFVNTPTDGIYPLTVTSSDPGIASVTSLCNITVYDGMIMPCSVTVDAVSPSLNPVTITASNSDAGSITSNPVYVTSMEILAQPNPSVIGLSSNLPSTTTVSFSLANSPAAGSYPLTVALSNPAAASVTPSSCTVTVADNGVVTPCLVTVTAVSASLNPVTVTASNPDAGIITSNPIYVSSGFSAPAGIALDMNNGMAYITNVGNNTVSECVADNYAVMRCIDSGATGLDQPYGISLNSAGTLAYITNFGSNTVSICAVGSTGALSGCTASPAYFDEPIGIALNSTGTIAYITNSNSNNNTVTQCAISSNGLLINCVNSGATGLSRPFGIALGNLNSGAGDYLTAYITNYANNTISQCVVSSENGSLSNCLVNSASTAQNLNQLSGPSGIVYYSTEGLLFVSNIQGSNLVQCLVNPYPYNLLSNCSSRSNSNVSQPYGIAVDDATDVIYATSFQNNTVTACMYGSGGCVTFPQ